MVSKVFIDKITIIERENQKLFEKIQIITT
jgi:hypothetical protein